MISSGEAGRSSILSWLASMFHETFFLYTTTIFSWTSLQISKGGVFSFLHLCSNVYTPYKVNVVERWLFFGFNNAFAFTLYSKMFPPFVRCTPSIVFLNGGYNFNLKRFHWNPQICHSPSFNVHWSSYLSSFLQWQ
jgi:hypothetical protein